MTRLLRDPLVVFLLIGGGIFLLYSKINPSEDIAEENPNRIDRQHMENSADSEYETDEWMPRFLDLPARILDRLQAELAAQRLRIAVGEQTRLVPGSQYDPD